MPAKEIDKIIKEVDYHGNGKINYSEFLAATISVQSFLTEEKLWMLFKHFDIDDTNGISKENIREALTKLGIQVTSEDIDKAMYEHDILKDGNINFSEFKAMLLGEFEVGEKVALKKHEDLLKPI